MRVLLIKTSSLGDIIHTLPALTDAGNAFPSIEFDWLVEENFAEIPRWHPQVKKVIPIAIRRWRQAIFSKHIRKEWQACKKKIRSEQYDYIIDAQGLLKTAWLVWAAKGVRCGFNWNSARESLASLLYQKKFFVGQIKDTHAIVRNRRLFSQVLGYEFSPEINYGIAASFASDSIEENYLVFLHGTTWPSKHWPESHWIDLAKLAQQNHVSVKIPWGNALELARAERIASHAQNVEVLPRTNLIEIAHILKKAKAVITVDTGLGHLAAALNKPTISLYGPTDAALTGILGPSQIHLSTKLPCSPCLSKTCRYDTNQPPCFAALSSDRVWDNLEK